MIDEYNMTSKTRVRNFSKIFDRYYNAIASPNNLVNVSKRLANLNPNLVNIIEQDSGIRMEVHMHHKLSKDTDFKCSVLTMRCMNHLICQNKNLIKNRRQLMDDLAETFKGKSNEVRKIYND